MMIEKVCYSPSHKIAGIVRSAESVRLDLLRAIDGTVAALAGIAKIMSGLTSMLESSVKEIRSMESVEGKYIDQDGTIVDAMERSAEKFKDFLTQLVQRK